MKKVKKYKYKFSIIMAIYNVENYLEEAIDSIINQTIGFEENIQLVLINDGSPDNSEEICLKYQEKYPNNIIYKKKENAGSAAARNDGMGYAEGKYINFFDPDDILNDDVLEKVYNFFEEHYAEIDLVGIRVRFFEMMDGFEHPADYKFNGDRVVDIFEDYDAIHLQGPVSFIKNKVAKANKFDERLQVSEDVFYVSKIIMDKKKYGIMKSAVYNYRKRAAGNSALNTSKQNISWYIDTPRYAYKRVFDYSKERFNGIVIPYIQYAVMYDLQWRLKNEISECLSETEKVQYIEMLQELLTDIDEYIIWQQRNLTREYKIYALCLKYNRDIRKEFYYKKDAIYFNNNKMYDIKNSRLFTINILKMNKNNLYMEGEIHSILPEEDYDLYFKDDKNNRYYMDYYDMSFKNTYGLNKEILKEVKGFRITIPICEINKLKVILSYKKYHKPKIQLNFGAYSKLNDKVRGSYYASKKYIINIKQDNILISKNKDGAHKRFEREYIKELKRRKEYSVIFYRHMYYILKKIVKKPIWIVSDRMNVANDNGMHLFKYLSKHEKNAKVYFVMSKKYPDFKKMKKYGNVLDCDSIRYKVYFLLAKNIISSQADECNINAFEDKKVFLRDLYRFNFVFLQHGITKDDLTSWLNKNNKNIRLFVTAAEPEYNSIVNGMYGYDKNDIKLTGFPRFDNLRDSRKRQIIFLPTWRRNLAGENNKETSIREYNVNFKESYYFKFYNTLINDPRLLECLAKNNYKAKFCIHPSLYRQYIDFKGNEYVTINDGIAEYQKEFADNALLITDFSSVAFDFAYLRKPVIYTQFDKDIFFKGHLYDKGYFEYERDGFGPVCYNYETALTTIINAIENDCKLDKMYEKRINRFYAYNDKNNCKRVHEEILKLK